MKIHIEDEKLVMTFVSQKQESGDIALELAAKGTFKPDALNSYEGAWIHMLKLIAEHFRPASSGKIPGPLEDYENVPAEDYAIDAAERLIVLYRNGRIRSEDAQEKFYEILLNMGIDGEVRE